jgi:hypothetical protein
MPGVGGSCVASSGEADSEGYDRGGEPDVVGQVEPHRRIPGAAHRGVKPAPELGDAGGFGDGDRADRVRAGEGTSPCQLGVEAAGLGGFHAAFGALLDLGFAAQLLPEVGRPFTIGGTPISNALLQDRERARKLRRSPASPGVKTGARAPITDPLAGSLMVELTEFQASWL